MKMSAGKNGGGGWGGRGMLVVEDNARYGVCSSLPGGNKEMTSILADQ
jgi:hypothetical protein